MTIALSGAGSPKQVLRMQLLGVLVMLCLLPVAQAVAQQSTSRAIVVWHGDTQRVGHLGDAQDDFNLMGHIEAWRDLDQLQYRINSEAFTPLSFRAYRRLVDDGDFNADVPIGRLRPGPNTIRIEAKYRDGQMVSKEVQVIREAGGPRPLPLTIRWAELKHLNDAGQAVDGHWELTQKGLRTRQTGYDRVFLIGARDWMDYDVTTSVTIHKVNPTTSPISGGNGLGIILRFAGHVAGGPRHFPSGQPKWGYQPFGAIGWLRWTREQPTTPPFLQFYPGENDRSSNLGTYPIKEGGTYGIRFACQTLPDAPNGSGVTRYRFKVWDAAQPEPNDWTWEQVQTSRTALRQGGFALLAHHVDVTFGDLRILSTSAADE